MAKHWVGGIRTGLKLLLLTVATLSAPWAYAQAACTPIHTSGLYNGINVVITTTNTETYPTSYTSCGVTTPADEILGGRIGAFTINYAFDTPLSRARLLITGANGGESFTLNTSSGAPTLALNASSCPPTIAGATVTFPGANDGADLDIRRPDAFTSLTVQGAGGQAGSIFTLCAEGLLPAAAAAAVTAVPTLGDYALLMLAAMMAA